MRRGEQRVAKELRTQDGRSQSAGLGLAIAGGLALVVAGVMLRVYFRDIPNFSPVAAIALYAGFALRRVSRAIWIPLGIMAASDLIIGGYETRLLLTVYAMLALPTLAGAYIRRCAGARWTQCSLAIGLTCLGSVAFFVVTNSAVWAFSTWYPRDLAGWWQCLSAGIPFFRYTLVGDLAFGTILFGGHALVAAVVQHGRTAAVAGTTK